MSEETKYHKESLEDGKRKTLQLENTINDLNYKIKELKEEKQEESQKILTLENNLSKNEEELKNVRSNWESYR